MARATQIPGSNLAAQIVGGNLSAESFSTGRLQAPPEQLEDAVARMISESARPPEALPATRAECETLMDTKHQHIAEAEARLLKAKADLDKLIGHHNNLPK